MYCSSLKVLAIAVLLLLLQNTMQLFQRMEHQVNYGGEYGRPGSRSGILEAVPFTHYVNYNELQTRIR